MFNIFYKWSLEFRWIPDNRGKYVTLRFILDTISAFALKPRKTRIIRAVPCPRYKYRTSEYQANDLILTNCMFDMTKFDFVFDITHPRYPIARVRNFGFAEGRGFEFNGDHPNWDFPGFLSFTRRMPAWHHSKGSGQLLLHPISYSIPAWATDA